MSFFREGEGSGLHWGRKEMIVKVVVIGSVCYMLFFVFVGEDHGPVSTTTMNSGFDVHSSLSCYFYAIEYE